MQMEAPQDIRTLVTSAQSGNRESFELLVRTEASRFRGVVASRVNAYLALGIEFDDVYQETLLRSFRSIQRFEWRGEDSLFRWVGKIAENVVLESARRAARERRAPLEEDVPDELVSPSSELRRGERFDRLEESLARLDPDHRQVILLTRVDGLSFSAVARRMGRSPDAVKQLLYRALKQLKSAFGDTESLTLPDRRLEGAEKQDVR